MILYIIISITKFLNNENFLLFNYIGTGEKHLPSILITAALSPTYYIIINEN